MDNHELQASIDKMGFLGYCGESHEAVYASTDSACSSTERRPGEDSVFLAQFHQPEYLIGSLVFILISSHTGFENRFRSVKAIVFSLLTAAVAVLLYTKAV